MTRNLKIFSGLVVLGTVGYLALDDAIAHLPDSFQALADFAMLVLLFWLVFNFVQRLIYRLVGVSHKLMFKGWKRGWPRPTHQQAAEMNKYWLVWLGGSLSTYLVYTLLFHRLEWRSALIFILVIVVIVTLAKLNSRVKIAGHDKKELFQ